MFLNTEGVPSYLHMLSFLCVRVPACVCVRVRACLRECVLSEGPRICVHVKELQVANDILLHYALLQPQSFFRVLNPYQFLIKYIFRMPRALITVGEP